MKKTYDYLPFEIDQVSLEIYKIPYFKSLKWGFICSILRCHSKSRVSFSFRSHPWRERAHRRDTDESRNWTEVTEHPSFDSSTNNEISNSSSPKEFVSQALFFLNLECLEKSKLSDWEKQNTLVLNIKKQHTYYLHKLQFLMRVFFVFLFLWKLQKANKTRLLIWN